MNQFSNIAVETMKRKSISIKQLSIGTKLSAPYLYDLLRYTKKRWNSDTIEAVSDYLGISIHFKVH